MKPTPAPLPLCVCGCNRPAMPGSPWYYLCKMLREGWKEGENGESGEYVEALPFDTPVIDPHWDVDSEACK